MKPSVDRELELLRAAFEVARKAERIESAPYFPLFGVDTVRPEFAEPAEVDAIITHLRAHDRDPEADYIQFLHESGWRPEEARGLLWSSVNMKGRDWEMVLPDSNTGDPRTLDLSGELRSLVEKRWKAREYRSRDGAGISPWVFHRDGRPIGDFRKAWKKAVAAVGRPELWIRDMRKCAARDLRRAGVPEGEAMAQLGQRTASMYRRYAITNARDHCEGRAKLEAYRREEREASAKLLDFPASS